MVLVRFFSGTETVLWFWFILYSILTGLYVFLVNLCAMRIGHHPVLSREVEEDVSLDSIKTTNKDHAFCDYIQLLASLYV